MHRRYYQDVPREAMNWLVEVGPVVEWGANRVDAATGFEGENASSDETWDDEYSYERAYLSVGYERNLPWDLTVQSECKYTVTDYDERDSTFLSYRHDHVLYGKLSLERKLSDNVAVRLSHAYTRSRSSIELYRYRDSDTYLVLEIDF